MTETVPHDSLLATASSQDGSPPTSAFADTKSGADAALTQTNTPNKSTTAPATTNTNSDSNSTTFASTMVLPGPPHSDESRKRSSLPGYPPLPPRKRNSALPGDGGNGTVRASANCTLATPFLPGPDNAVDPYAGKTIYDFELLDCNHELYNLRQHCGEVLLICNVASKCADYSESCYKTLAALYHRYHRMGFNIIAVPCNQFGGCEPGNEDEIAENIPLLYSDVDEVAFPVMAKVDVNGDHQLPLYAFLKARVKGTLGQSAVKWNFTAFLIDKTGSPIARFSADAALEEMAGRVVEALEANTAAIGTREPSVSDMGDVHTPQQDRPTERDDSSSSPEGGAQTVSPDAEDRQTSLT